MKKLLAIGILGFAFTSCLKDYSDESGSSASNENIIGADCRISKIVYADSATNKGKGAITATINTSDRAVDVTSFDSLSFTLNYQSVPTYIGNDTIKINADEYFVVNPVSKQVLRLHRLIDPTNPLSPKIDVDYTYDGAGYLTSKTQLFQLIPLLPPVPIVSTVYTYTGGNLTGIVSTDLITTDKITDAVVTYNATLSPKNYLYIFPDEDEYAWFTQFLNFGRKPLNAVSSITVNTYDPGNVLKTTEVSTFSSYILSKDNYVKSVIMKGDIQASIPAEPGKLIFSYTCK